MTPVDKNEMVIRGREQTPMISVRDGGNGSILVKAAGLIKECTKFNKVDGNPICLKISLSGVTGYLLGLPLAKYDSNAPDHFELKWDPSMSTARIDLLPVLQPRSMAVAPEHVLEIPVSAEVNGSFKYLVIHLAEAKVRAEAEGTPRKKKTEEEETGDGTEEETADETAETEE